MGNWVKQPKSVWAKQPLNQMFHEHQNVQLLCLESESILLVESSSRGFPQDHKYFRATGSISGFNQLNMWTGLRTVYLLTYFTSIRLIVCKRVLKSLFGDHLLSWVIIIVLVQWKSDTEPCWGIKCNFLFPSSFRWRLKCRTFICFLWRRVPFYLSPVWCVLVGGGQIGRDKPVNLMSSVIPCKDYEGLFGFRPI